MSFGIYDGYWLIRENYERKMLIKSAAMIVPVSMVVTIATIIIATTICSIFKLPIIGITHAFVDKIGGLFRKVYKYFRISMFTNWITGRLEHLVRHCFSG
jgi:hypothetical protein